MNVQLPNHDGRPQRFDNGAAEIFFGLMQLGFALLSHLQTALPKDSIWNNGWAGLLFMYLVLIPVLGIGYWVTKAINKHIAWPRTGYVVYRRDVLRVRTKSWWAVIISCAVASAVIAGTYASLRSNSQGHSAMSLLGIVILTILVGSYSYWVFRMSRENPWKWLVVVFMASGLLAIGLPVRGDDVAVMRDVMLFVGLVWLASGGITLGLFMWHRQPAAPEME